MTIKCFYAYPDDVSVRAPIDRAVTTVSAKSREISVKPWPQINIAGRFIIEAITESIDDSDVVIADITISNFNVYYEIGYALGKRKVLITTKNVSKKPSPSFTHNIGILDTLGYQQYQNSEELAEYLQGLVPPEPLSFPAKEIDKQRPVFVLEPRTKGEGITLAKRRLEKEGIQFRAFDPVEEPRLALTMAFNFVQESVAVVLHLLNENDYDCEDNNLRAAFIAGLAHGLEKRILILQEGDGPVPIDYRDFVDYYQTEEQLDQHFKDLAPRILQALQQGPEISPDVKKTVLEKIELGALSAENEAEKLRDYYLETDQTRRMLSGSIRLAVGRKGTGKTALFYHAKDQLSQDKRNCVITIKPDGYQIKRFKEYVLGVLDEPTKEHVSTAFWEYVLLLEISKNLLERDSEKYLRNHKLFEKYNKVKESLVAHGIQDAADFTDLLATLIERLREHFSASGSVLTASAVTRALYPSDITTLREMVKEYLSVAGHSVWMLFDNLDKGWPVRGVAADDVLILRGLIDGLRKIEQYLERFSIKFKSTIFIRNDVFDYLVDQTPDRGKEAKVSLDWTDKDALKELLRKRLARSAFNPGDSFEEIWRQISVSQIEGIDSAEYLLDRCMMRPRNLLALASYCRSASVNLQHHRILEGDIAKGLDSYSSDVCRDVGYEMRDIYPDSEDILYLFLSSKSHLTLLALEMKLGTEYENNEDILHIIELLVWFGFLGVVMEKNGSEKELYIYDANYDIKKLKKMSGDFNNPETLFCINKAFWPFLEID